MSGTLRESSCVKRGGHVACAALLGLGLVAMPGSALAQQTERRWDLEEKPYEQMTTRQKIGSNLRVGAVGFVDSLGQGLFSGAAILSPYGGFLVRKVATGVGDVVGLVDDNRVTHGITQGILSRHLLRFGAGARGFRDGIGVIHDTTFKGPELSLQDYVGDETFHTRAYLEPSAMVTLFGVIMSNIVIRPVGSLATLVGARETGDSLNEFGLDLIERSFEAGFL